MKPFNKLNYDWTLEGLARCIEENKLESEIIVYNEYGAIVHVKSYNDSIILGAESTWCISQHRESWTQYVEKRNAVQLFFYCFDKSTKSDDSLYGATFDVEKNKAKVYCCFTRENNPIAKAHKTKTDEEAIKAVIEDYYGDIFNELKREVIKIHNKPKEEKKPTVEKQEMEYAKKRNLWNYPSLDEYFGDCLWCYD